MMERRALVIAATVGEWAEGYERHMYLCSEGHTTIGIGLNLDAGVDYDLAKHIQKYLLAKIVAHLRTEPYWDRLGPVRQAALVDMVYNLGWSRFLGFKKMRQALVLEKYEQAAYEAVASRWYNQVGRRGPLIVTMIRTGKEPEL